MVARFALRPHLSKPVLRNSGVSEIATNPLVVKLSGGRRLSQADRIVMDEWIAASADIPARDLVVAEGDRNQALYVIVAGWACCFTDVAGRNRQITAFLIPGDHVASHQCFDFEFGHGVSTLGPCRIAEVSRESIEAAERDHPDIIAALDRSRLVAEAIGRVWLAALGRRSAEQRTAHLFCELFHRLDAVGLTQAGGYPMPLTQSVLSDALGLSPAHVNRTLQSLRTRKLIAFENGLLDIPSLARLQKFAGFDPRYLRLAPMAALA